MGESPKSGGVFLQNTQYWVRYKLISELLVRQTSNHHHCDKHIQKANCTNFQVILTSSSWSKTTLYVFKKQIWPPNKKCYGNIWNVRNTLSLPLESRYISRVPSFLHSQNSMIFPWFEIKLLWKKLNSILTREKCSKSLNTPHILVFGHADSSDTGFEAVHSDISELWAICMHYLGNYSS